MIRPDIIIRRFKRNIGLKAVSIMCLSVAFACLILLVAYAKFELSYDRFHAKGDRIFRITTEKNEGQPDARVYGDWKNFAKEIAGIESVTRIAAVRQATFSFDSKIFNLDKAYYVDSLFFQTFSYPLKVGDSKNPFPNQNSVVVSEGFAQKYFYTENIVGKAIKIASRDSDGYNDYVIAGIMKDFPPNTHFKAELVMAIPHDFNVFFYTYLLLQTPEDAKVLPKRIVDAITKTEGDTTQQPIFRLQSIADIHLHSNKAREMERNGSYQSLILLISAVALVLLIALINLSNNSRVLFLKNRDYYILKRTHGATIGVLILEEIVQSLIASLFIVLFGFWFVFYLNTLLNIEVFSILSKLQLASISIAFIAVLVLVMILPIVRYFIKDFFSINRNAENTYMSKSKSLAMRGFIIAQVTISVFVIIMSIGVSKQMNYVLNTQMGGKIDGIIVLPTQPNSVVKNFDKFKEELLRDPKILAVTAAMEPPVGAIRDYAEISYEGTTQPNPFDILCIDGDFFSFFDLNVLAGTMLPRYAYTYEWEAKSINAFILARYGVKTTEEIKVPAEYSDCFLINKSAMKQLGVSEANEVIGKRIRIASNPNLDIIPGGRVVGVVDDFKYTSMFDKERPLIILQRRMFTSNFLIRYDTAYTKDVIASVKDKWSKINPDYPLNYEPLPETYRNFYYNEFSTKRFLGYFALLSLIISALGLVVMMSFFIRYRLKEIGIRKVNGANSIDILILLNKDLVVWVLVAFAVASPVAYFTMGKWLQNFAYQTSVTWWVFAGAFLIVLFVALFTVSWQSIRAARMNPVDAIRYE